MTLLNIFKRAKEGDYVLMASGLLKPVVASYTIGSSAGIGGGTFLLTKDAVYNEHGIRDENAQDFFKSYSHNFSVCLQPNDTVADVLVSISNQERVDALCSRAREQGRLLGKLSLMKGLMTQFANESEVLMRKLEAQKSV